VSQSRNWQNLANLGRVAWDEFFLKKTYQKRNNKQFVIALLIRVLPRSRAPISLQENGSLGVPPHPMGL